MKKFLIRINILIATGLLISYGSMFVSPHSFWPAGFMSITFPFWFVLNILFTIGWVFKKQYKILLISAFSIVVCYGQIQKLANINFPDEPDPGAIKVLSANVRIFNVYQYLQDQNPDAPKQMIQWLKQSDHDILTIQEFYNEPGNKRFESTRLISSAFPHFKVFPTVVNRVGAEFGLAIFSKHPILNAQKINFQNSKHNQAIFADIKVKNDTIRIINIHLESMHIEEGELFEENNDQNDLSKKSKRTIRKLKNGFQMRAEQINQVVDFIKSSKYPVIICGDLNDTPFSYTYESLREVTTNSFEQKGFGLGSTYNGRIPFLRIDNQFFDHNFSIKSFKIHKDIDLSDHYPITGVYQLKK